MSRPGVRRFKHATDCSSRNLKNCWYKLGGTRKARMILRCQVCWIWFMTALCHGDRVEKIKSCNCFFNSFSRS
eukprot:12904929-Prorocentrum_lima.AAC.1